MPECVSTCLVGILLVFSLGADHSILFSGVEQGTLFAAESAIWGIPGGDLLFPCILLIYELKLCRLLTGYFFATMDKR